MDLRFVAVHCFQPTSPKSQRDGRYWVQHAHAALQAPGGAPGRNETTDGRLAHRTAHSGRKSWTSPHAGRAAVDSYRTAPR